MIFVLFLEIKRLQPPRVCVPVKTKHMKSKLIQ